MPGGNWTTRLIYGADGRPGKGGVDENGNWDGSVEGAGNLDEVSEFNLFSGGAIDLDGDGVIDPGQEANNAAQAFAEANDDYHVIMGAAPPANARLLDFLRYRVMLELKRQSVTLTSGASIANVLPDADRSVVGQSSYSFTVADMDEAEQRINLVIYGNNAATADAVRFAQNNPTIPILASYGGLIAPEVVAGLKMDVNRPFGDGRDNNGNGVVDEPQEAGEPWVDSNGNGVWEAGEPYLDLDGDGRFYADADVSRDNVVGDGVHIDPSSGAIDADDLRDFTPDGINNPLPIVDRLYAEQLGFPIDFDHTNGVDANGRGALDNAGGVVHDDGRMARQLYARHLYCLMLLVMDEDYLAPFDPKDPQVAHYLDPESFGQESTGTGRPPITRRSVANQIKMDLMANQGFSDADANAQARRIAQRKLTCRRIAQWAINCADMRDADAICTPFEYDENPWDGWNVVDTLGGRVLPIDGDLTTDENYQYSREVSNTGWSNPRRVDGYGNNAAAIPDSEVVAAYDQTRGLVWGVERPELLLTEGLAMHDRRVSNETAGGLLPIGEAAAQVNNNDQNNEPPEDDLDQFYRPKGVAFVEVYNPWSPDSPKPAELYRDRFGRYRFCEMDRDDEGDGPPVDNNNDGIADGGDLNSDVRVEGVLLDRLSDAQAAVIGVDGQPKGFTAPSPVWRMICIEQHPQLRNDDPFDNEVDRGASDYLSFERGLGNDKAPQAYRDVAAEAMETDEVVLSTLAGNNIFGNRADRTLTRLRASLSNLRGEVPDPPRIPDPDFPTFDREALPTVSRSGGRFVFKKPLEYIEREWYFTREPSFDSTGNPINGAVPFNPSDVELCMPDRPVRVKLGVGGVSGVSFPTGLDERSELWPEGVTRFRLPNGSTGDLLIYRRSFPPVEQIPNNELARTQGGGRYRTLPLAPILPGQYGVIGSAGFEYTQLPGMYVTRIGRTENETAESVRLGDTAVRGVRRIELIPNRNPYLHQVCVGRNLGDEYRLMAPTPVGGTDQYVINATDPSRMPNDAGDLADTIAGVKNMKEFNDNPSLPAFYTSPANARAGSGFQSYEIDPSSTDDMRLYCVRPAVAVPVAGMNISEPIDQYVLRRAELDEGFSIKWRQNEYAGEGTYGERGGADEIGYDVPFDIAPELIVNHTTPNYRSVHLQRLANPLLAWNPAPLKVDGTAHPQHDPSRPVNPYLTIDSMSLDVTAMNSINTDEEQINPDAAGEGNNQGEDNLPPRTDGLVQLLNGQQVDGSNDPAVLHKQAHYRPVLGNLRAPGAGGVSEQNDSNKVMMVLGTQFRGSNEQSLEYESEDNSFGGPPLISTLQPGRVIWRQERPNQLIDILDSRIDNTSVREARGSYEPAEAGDTPIEIAAQEILQASGALQNLTLDYVLQHSLGYDNSAVVRRWALNPDYDNANGQAQGQTNREDSKFYRAEVELVGSYTSEFNRDPFNANPAGYCYRVDLNGDGLMGDIVGVPLVNEANTFQHDDPRTNPTETGEFDYRDNDTYPWLTWNDRPFASSLEMLQAPATSSSRLTVAYTTANAFVAEPPSRYDGFSAPQPDRNNGVGDSAHQGDNGEYETNLARLGAFRHPYGHLLNMFQAASSSSVVLEPGDNAIPVGAGNLYRVTDYLHTPSRFLGTDTLMDPTLFNPLGSDLTTPADNITLGDPRRAFQAPFNRVADYREPGKVNLNTIVGRTDANERLDRWSPVYDGLMHRVDDGNDIDYANNFLNRAGHLGPAWRDVVLSRRGYSVTSPRSGQDYSPATLHRNFPSRFANPFRSAEAGDLVPIAAMWQYDVDASILRAHPYSPGQDAAWGIAGVDDALVNKSGGGGADGDLLIDNAAEAGFANDVLLVRANGSLPDSQKEASQVAVPIEPLFGSAITEPSLDAGRNPGIAYSPMTRLENMTTTRSGCFAIWITVGFFEVTPAPDWNDPDANAQAATRARFGNSRDLYNRVYPDGYQLGREINIDTGDTKRFRAFYIVDRTRPVAFKPGEDVNTEGVILVRRRIE
ncbi:MAG: hypothetical protein AAF589_01750 [Planctomycetota bacterium]